MSGSEKTDDILHDFQKLAVAKAEIKLMIVQYNTEYHFENIKKACEDSIHENFRNDGSEYKLIGSGNGKNDLEVKWEKLWAD